MTEEEQKCMCGGRYQKVGTSSLEAYDEEKKSTIKREFQLWQCKQCKRTCTEAINLAHPWAYYGGFPIFGGP